MPNNTAAPPTGHCSGRRPEPKEHERTRRNIFAHGDRPIPFYIYHDACSEQLPELIEMYGGELVFDAAVALVILVMERQLDDDEAEEIHGFDNYLASVHSEVWVFDSIRKGTILRVGKYLATGADGDNMFAYSKRASPRRPPRFPIEPT